MIFNKLRQIVAKSNVAIFVLFGSLISAVSLHADVTTDAGAFSWVGAGVRPMGMGGAFTAVSDDVNAVFTNPAGIAGIKSREIGYTQADLFNLKIARQQQVALVYPKLGPVPVSLGVGLNYLRIKFDPDSWAETEWVFTLAKQIMPFEGLKDSEEEELVTAPGLSIDLGLSFKLLKVNSNFSANTFGGVTVAVDDAEATGQSFDAGILIHAGDRVTVGLALLDIVSYLKWETGLTERLAKRIRVGAAVRPLKGILISVEPEMTEQSGSWYVGRASGGIELWAAGLLKNGLGIPYIKDVGIRAGVSRDLQDNLGSDIGGGLSIRAEKFDIEYALISKQGATLGLTHRWGFSTKF